MTIEHYRLGAIFFLTYEREGIFTEFKLVFVKTIIKCFNSLLRHNLYRIEFCYIKYLIQLFKK